MGTAVSHGTRHTELMDSFKLLFVRLKCLLIPND